MSYILVNIVIIFNINFLHKFKGGNPCRHTYNESNTAVVVLPGTGHEGASGVIQHCTNFNLHILRGKTTTSVYTFQITVYSYYATATKQKGKLTNKYTLINKTFYFPCISTLTILPHELFFHSTDFKFFSTMTDIYIFSICIMKQKLNCKKTLQQ